MNKWMEIVLAWFVGGLVGRLLGHTYLVGYLGWPEICGWLSVPIGSAVAWLAVEIKVIIPAIRHACRWTPSPLRLTGWVGCIHLVRKNLTADCHKFKDNWGWRVLNATSLGLLIGLWLIVLGIVGAIAGENCIASDFGESTPIVCGGIFLLTFAFCSAYAVGWSNSFLEDRGWDGFFDRRQTDNSVRDGAIDSTLEFLQMNPISVYALLLFAVAYYIVFALKAIIVWLGKIIWRTIRMINSSQRMAAMTGSAIGLSISQIYGYNPVLCGGVCVMAGLIERAVFVLVEGAARGKIKQAV